MNIWSGIELGAMKFVALFINNGESLSESLYPTSEWDGTK